jgi:hypothetical protein
MYLFSIVTFSGAEKAKVTYTTGSGENQTTRVRNIMLQYENIVMAQTAVAR